MTPLYSRCSVIRAAAVCLAAACSQPTERIDNHDSRQTTASFATRVVEDTTSSGSDDGQWIMPARNYASTRYSGLSQITTENVGRLHLAWSFSTGVTRGHEAAPLVVGSTMYVVTPYPNLLHAFDLTRPGSPPKWTYRPSPVPAAQGVACCDVVNRGAAYFDGRIFYNTLDAQVVAVDAATGKEAWKTRVGDINKGETMTMAPLVVKGKVLVGNSGGEMGVRGWLTALDAGSGKIAWRGTSYAQKSGLGVSPERLRRPAASDCADRGSADRRSTVLPGCLAAACHRRNRTYGSCLQQPTRTVTIGHGSPPFRRTTGHTKCRRPWPCPTVAGGFEGDCRLGRGKRLASPLGGRP